MHLLSRIGSTCYYFNTMQLKILTMMHSSCFIVLLRVIIHAFAISYSMIMHIGSTEEITLLEFNKEEEGDQQETPQSAALGEEE